MSTIGPRPRSLPLAPTAKPAERKLPIFGEARDIDRRWRPIYVVWETTLACDLACRHCGSRAGRARPDELTTDEAIDLVDQMAALGVKEVTVIGGEAYLRDDWTDIIKRIRSHGISCSMTTGGRGLTLERARAGKEAGLLSVSVSIDGFRETHDALRAAQGSFDAAMQAMDNLKAVGIPFSCNTQINRHSMPELEALFDFLVERGMHSWQMQLTTAMGRGGDEPDMLLQPYELLELFPMLVRMKRRADEKKVRFWTGNNIGYYGPHEAELRRTFPGSHRGSCGAGRLSMGIEANGDIKGCPSLPTQDYVGGNIRDAKLVDIWEGTKELRFTRDMTVEDLYGYCRTCYYAEDCKSGCNWTTHVLFGKVGNNPMCHHRALDLAEKGRRERLVKTHGAPGLPFDYSLFEIIEEAFPEDERAKYLELAHAAMKRPPRAP